MTSFYSVLNVAKLNRIKNGQSGLYGPVTVREHTVGRPYLECSACGSQGPLEPTGSQIDIFVGAHRDCA